MPPVTTPAPAEEEADEGDSAADETSGYMETHDTSEPISMEIDAELRSNTSHASIYDTEIDSFGIFRSYYRQQPSFTSEITMDLLCDSPRFAVQRKVRKWWSGIARSLPLDSESHTEDTDRQWDAAVMNTIKETYFQPFENATSFLLMNWFYSGSNMKTLAELDRLVQDVLLKPDFNHEHLLSFRAARESQRVDAIKDKSLADSLFQAADGWYKVAINIPVPFERVQHDSWSDVPMFRVESLFFRRPIEVIKAALQEALPEDFHLQPFKMYWHHDENDPDQLERVYTDLYNADAFLDEHDHIQKMCGDSEHECIIAAIMLWSDSTQLANFGTASLYPIYLFLGNQSKYMRCKPGAFAAHHIAYIPKVGRIFYFRTLQLI